MSFEVVLPISLTFFHLFLIISCLSVVVLHFLAPCRNIVCVCECVYFSHNSQPVIMLFEFVMSLCQNPQAF